MTDLDTDSTTLCFVIPERLWMSANGRQLHWAAASKRKKELRQLGCLIARSKGVKNLDTCHVAAFIGYPPKAHRADPSNERVTKHLIDGLVDAGVWPDDDHTHVIGPTYLRDKGTGKAGVHTVRLVMTPQGIPWSES